MNDANFVSSRLIYDRIYAQLSLLACRLTDLRRQLNRADTARACSASTEASQHIVSIHALVNELHGRLSSDKEEL